MAKRLQVILQASEYTEICRVAGARGMTPAEWVREALDVARRGESTAEVHRKLATIRAAAKHEFPFDDIAS